MQFLPESRSVLQAVCRLDYSLLVAPTNSAVGLEQLPGCNPIQSGPTRANAVNSCNSNTPSGNSFVSRSAVSFVADTSVPQWTRLGCAKEPPGGRILTELWTDRNATAVPMNVDRCVQHCSDAGWRYAGLENGNEVHRVCARPKISAHPFVTVLVRSGSQQTCYRDRWAIRLRHALCRRFICRQWHAAALLWRAEPPRAIPKHRATPIEAREAAVSCSKEDELFRSRRHGQAASVDGIHEFCK